MDTLRTDVAIKLDMERRLRFDFAALCRMEEAGVRTRDGISLRSVGLREVALILWAGLAGEDPSLQVEDVIRILGDMPGRTDQVMAYVTEKIEEGLKLAFGPEIKKKAEEMMRRVGLSGERSGASASADSASPDPSSSP